MNKELIKQIINLAKRRTRKKGVFDDEMFLLHLSDFFKENHVEKEDISELIYDMLMSKEENKKLIGLTILEWNNESNKNINNMLVRLYEKVDFNSSLYNKIHRCIWKYKVSSGLPALLRRFEELKNIVLKKLYMKESMITSIAECAFSIDKKVGSRLLYDVIKRDSKIRQVSMYSHTAVIFDNVLRKFEIDVLDEIFDLLLKADLDLRKYVLEECIKGFNRSKYPEEKRKKVVDYIHNRLGI